MAVERTGTPTHVESQTEDSSVAVTIPADVDVCVVLTTGYDNVGGAQMFDELTWDAGNTVDFVHVGTGYSSLAHLKIVEIDTLMPKK